MDNSLTVSDVDNLTLPSVNVSIGSGFQSSEDVLSFTNDGSMGNITGNYDPAQGALMLTSAGSTATLAQWQAALRSVRYNNTSATPDTTERTMQITANDGVQDSSGTNKHVTISQPVYFDISGTVKGSDTNQGIAATIQLKDNMGGNVGAAVPAAADGSYTITGVLAGTGYYIAVSMPGYTEGYITAFDVINANITGKDITLQKTAVPPVKVLTSIVVTPPAKTIYKIGQSLDTTGMIVIARYSDGSQAVVYGYSITGFSSAVAGTNTVTVSYGGKSAAFLVTISAKGLQNIILTAPVKTVYQIGDAFDSTGMKVTAVWDDNTTEDVTTIATISGFDSTTAGTKVITVIYGGKSSAFSIEVRGKTLSSLALIQPSKLTYVLGEAFDQSGLKVTARYADGSTEDVTAAVVLSGFDSSTAGIKTITVNYGGKNVTFTITVQDKKVKKLTVIPPTKMEYLVGEALDTTGMVVTASYADNSTADVTSSAAVRGYDKTKAKRQTVTISYGGKKDTFSVTVKEKTGLKSISIDSIPSKTVYYVGDAFDPTGMKVSALYKDGSRDDVTDLVSISFSSRKAGNETVDVRFRGKTESFKVTVQELSITGILVNPEAVILQKNKSLTLKVVAIDANGDKHTVTSKADYASSDPKVASVNGNGKIRGKKAGTAQITLTYRGYSKIVNVIVD